MNPWTLLIVVLLAAGLSFAMVAWIRRWAERRQLLDMPNHRSSHTTPTTRGGGLAIATIMLVGLLAVSWSAGKEGQLLPLVVAAALVAVVSWLDDLYSLSSALRFGTHALASALVLGFCGFLQPEPLPAWSGLLLSALWIVGLTNAYNFMDGIDGIAGLQAVVAGSACLVLGSFDHEPALQGLGALAVGASLGFLGHNWPPARIFMGDVGSAFLGFVFAAVVFATERPGRSLGMMVAALWPFLFDTIFTFCRRALRGENVFAAHRSHLYQRLVIAGHRHVRVTTMYGLLAAAGAGLGGAHLAGAIRLEVVVACLAAAALTLWGFVGWVERRSRRVVSKPQTSVVETESASYR